MGRPRRVTVVLPQSLDGPGAWRALGLAQALASAGCQARLLFWGESVPPTIQALAGDVAVVPLQPEPGWRPARGRRWWGRARLWQRWHLGRNDVGAAFAAGRPEAMVVTQAWPGLLNQARRGLRLGSGRDSRGRVAVDLVDWHPEEVARGRGARLTRRWTPRAAADRVGRAVVVSEYAGEELSRGGAATLVVPPLFAGTVRQLAQEFQASNGLDPAAAELRPASEEPATLPASPPCTPPPLRLLISGTAPWLDRGVLSNCIHAVAEATAEARPDQPRIELHIAGHPRQAVAELPGITPEAISDVVFHGLLPGPHIWALVASCDFLVLQRPAGERWVRMGFPSKIAEAWTLGTPVITNLVSDVGRYAQDGVNAIVLADESPEAMRSGIDQALAARDSFDRAAIAAWSATHFAPEVYGGALREFLLG